MSLDYITRRRKRALPPSMSDKESYDLNFTTDLPLKSISAEQTRNDTNGLSPYASCVMEHAGNSRGQKTSHLRDNFDRYFPL